MSSSLKLVVECHRRGLLSKEAAARVINQRNDMIGVAMRKVAHDLVVSILSADPIDDATKTAGFGDFIDNFRRPAAKVVTKAEGFMDKLRKGGLTGGGKVTDAAGNVSHAAHGWSDVGLNLTKMLGLAGLTAGATAGVGAVMRHGRDKKLQAQIQDSYHEMFNQVPKLKEYQEDPEHKGSVERNFGIIAQFAPSLAAVPSVAGAWVKATIGMGALGPADIKNLAETQRRIDEMHEGRRGGPSLSPIRAEQIAQTALGG